MLKKFKVPDRNDSSKSVEITRYVIDSKEKPTGVIFGKFSPWSGKNGHGKLVDFAKKHFKDIIVVSPTRSSKDPKVDIFSDEDKEDIIKKATGLNFHRIPSSSPIKMFTSIVDLGYSRPVLIVGEDRGDEFSKFFIEYDKNNKGIEDKDDKDFGKGEYLVVPRDENGTSATKVREALLSQNKVDFKKLTGYDDDMYEFMKDRIKNVKENIDFSQFYWN